MNPHNREPDDTIPDPIQQLKLPVQLDVTPVGPHNLTLRRKSPGVFTLLSKVAWLHELLCP
jgi:hypothetical protein